MPETTINITGLEGLQRVMSKLTGPQLAQAMQRATHKIGLQIESRIRQEPGPVSYPIRWKSQEQRAWYFWARRNDNLDPKFVRNSDPWSQRLPDSWVVEPLGDSGTVVGTRVTYAHFVQSEEFQQPMHKATGWKTDKQVVDEVERSGIIKRIVEVELSSLLRSL